MSNLTSNKSAAIKSTIFKYQWNWQGQILTVAYETSGKVIPDKKDTHNPGFDSAQPSVVERSRNHNPGYIHSGESPNGTPILLLPSFSTVSSRSEMSGLAQLLSSEFQVTTVDFPGFGDSSRSKLDYSPPLYRQFVEDFVRDIYAGAPVTIIAAGHGAGYALNLAASVPESVAKLVLVAPTWRGPLPTMAGGQKPWLKVARELIRTPILGQFLYQVTTTPSFLSFMYRRHLLSF